MKRAPGRAQLAPPEWRALLILYHPLKRTLLSVLPSPTTATLGAQYTNSFRGNF